MRAILKLTVAAAALMAVTGTAMAAMKASEPASAPLAVPLGVTYASARAALPPGVTAEQAAMAAAMGMMRNAEIYADGNGMTLYTFDPNVKLSTDATIGTLVDDAGAKALLEKNFPGLSTNPALGQARGMTLKAVKQFLPGLTDDKLKSLDEELGKLPPSGPVVTSCAGECLKTWPAYLAPTNAAPVGLWSVVAREDGSKQWAFDGKPLHVHAKDERPGDAKGNKAEGGKWNYITVRPAPPIPMPVGLRVTETMNYDGKVLVDARGMTLYTSTADKPNMSSCNAACTRTWQPLAAPRLAVPIGDFSVADRPDGMKQWAYKGKPLYTYASDEKAGEAKGNGGQWQQVTMVRYYFPPAVEVLNHAKHGPMLATVSGQTLYARDAHRFTLAGGSHDDRSALRGNPSAGTRIGVNGCIDDCLKNFTPLKVAAGALPWGDWSIVKRADGVQQWAYRGYPLYTYAEDKKPGDAIAHDMYKLTDGTTGLFWRVALP